MIHDLIDIADEILSIAAVAFSDCIAAYPCLPHIVTSFDLFHLSPQTRA